MAARSLQSVTITFGLVTIPVKMYAATNPRAGVSFTMLDAKGGRVKQQYISAESGDVVPRNEMIKGYEFEKDRFVTFTKEELKALEQASSGAIEITEFVPAASIDPVFYEKAYYLGPDKVVPSRIACWPKQCATRGVRQSGAGLRAASSTWSISGSSSRG